MFSTLLQPALFTLSMIAAAFTTAEEPATQRQGAGLSATPPALAALIGASTSTGAPPPEPTAAPEAGTSHDPFGKD